MKVIAGYLKSRKLMTPQSRQTRPTSAKIRGAIFNALGQYFTADTTVLDLFAGSGALAIEAISRGSEQAITVESNRCACQTIRTNCANLRIQHKLSMYCGDYRKYLASSQESFDLIFIDPPYKMKVIAEILDTLFTKQFVRKNGRIVIELSNDVYTKKDLAFLADYHIVFNRTYGMTQIIIIKEKKGDIYE